MFVWRCKFDNSGESAQASIAVDVATMHVTKRLRWPRLKALTAWNDSARLAIGALNPSHTVRSLVQVLTHF
jgi:hypothetical protein